MFKIINKYKKGVSPVIAVVLLIALTVAAFAVLAFIVGPLLAPTASVTWVSTSTASFTSENATFTAVISFSIPVTLSSASIDGETAFFGAGGADGATIFVEAAGQRSITLFANGTGFDTSMLVQFSYTPEGGNPAIFSQTFSFTAAS
jgi:flagellin-like protein